MENDFDGCTSAALGINADISSVFQLNEKILRQLVVDYHGEGSSVGVLVRRRVHILPVAGSQLGVTNFLPDHFQNSAVETISGAFAKIVVCLFNGMMDFVNDVQSVDSDFHF